MSYVSSLFHIVFGTKNRVMSIRNEDSEKLYRFIWNKLRELNCRLVRINGMPDHVHILVDVNPTQSLSELMRVIKSESSWFLKNSPEFPNFEGWGRGYFAASVSYDVQDGVIEYIKSQREHHKFVSFQAELDKIYAEVCAKPHPNDLQ